MPEPRELHQLRNVVSPTRSHRPVATTNSVATTAQQATTNRPANAPARTNRRAASTATPAAMTKPTPITVPQRTALVVVDMVPFFVDANPFARGIVANVNRLATALRAAGGYVAWVLPAPSPMATHREFYGEVISASYQDSGADGPLQGRLATGLTSHADDIYLEKTSPSALFPGRCDLVDHLQQRDVATVIVVGTLANVCCESTVRDASTLGYRTVMVADANAAVRDEDLNATLHTVYRSFGDVRTTDELINLIGSTQAGAGPSG